MPVSGQLDEVIAALFEGSMIPVKVSWGQSPSFAPPSPPEVDRLTHILQHADAIARSQAPGNPPTLDIAAALWAARVFLFACNRLVDRVEVETQLPVELVDTEPAGSKASEHWSIDLIFRSWWDLIKRSTAEHQRDPLNETLLTIASRWPLAAVGTAAQIREDRMSVIWNHPSLRCVYVDRVIGRSDHARQSPPWWSECSASLTDQDVRLSMKLGQVRQK